MKALMIVELGCVRTSACHMAAGMHGLKVYMCLRESEQQFLFKVGQLPLHCLQKSSGNAYIALKMISRQFVYLHRNKERNQLKKKENRK